MKITIDTEEDNYEAARKALASAFGKPDPTDEEEDDYDIEDEGLSDDDDYLPGNWNRKRINKLLLGVANPAYYALKYIAENAPADIDETIEFVRGHFEWESLDGRGMGGVMSSIGAAKRYVAKNSANIYVTDYNKRVYRMEPAIAKAMLEEMAIIEEEEE